MNISTAIYGLGYTAPEPRPDQMRVLLSECSTPCVTCHADGTFSYWDDHAGCWVENDGAVPSRVLDYLPTDERNRVMRAMTAAGVVAE